MLPLLIGVAATGQKRPWPGVSDTERFSKSVTCVVLEENTISFYNSEIRDAVDKYWKITPVKYITAGEFDLMKSDPSYSFIILTLSTFSNDKSGTLYDFLNLLQGTESDDIDRMPEFCTVPLSLAGDAEEEYSYKLGLLVRFMQHHAEMIVTNPSVTALRYLTYYNKNVPEVKDKTIMVRKDDLAPEVSSVESIAAYYPYKVMIVEEEDIIEAIEEQQDILVVHKVGPEGMNGNGTCIKMLLGADDAVLYYYNSHMAGRKNANGLLVSDFKRLGRF